MMSSLHSLWTVIAMVTFIGVVIWAWSGSRKAEFDKMARMPMEDEQPVTGQSTTDGEEQKNG